MTSKSPSSATKRRNIHHSTSSSTKATDASEEQAYCASAKALKLPEIVENVFSNLSACELFAVARVSRTFNDILKTAKFQKKLGLAHTREMTEDDVNNGNECPELRDLPFRGTVALQLSHEEKLYTEQPEDIGQDIIKFGLIGDLLDLLVARKVIAADQIYLPIVIARSKSIRDVVFRFNDLELKHVCCSGEHRLVHLHFDACASITSQILDLKNSRPLQWPPDNPKASWMKMKISEISAGVRVSLGPCYCVSSNLVDDESLVLSAEDATIGNLFSLLDRVCALCYEDDRFLGF